MLKVAIHERFSANINPLVYSRPDVLEVSQQKLLSIVAIEQGEQLVFLFAGHTDEVGYVVGDESFVWIADFAVHTEAVVYLAGQQDDLVIDQRVFFHIGF